MGRLEIYQDGEWYDAEFTEAGDIIEKGPSQYQMQMSDEGEPTTKETKVKGKETIRVGCLLDDGAVTLVRELGQHEIAAGRILIGLETKPFEVREYSGAPIILIPKKWAYSYSKGTSSSYKPSKGPCEYNSLSSYMRNLFGMELHNADFNWFTDNPLVDTHGTPMDHMLEVAQQLIEPYGLRVSRVNLAAGVVPMGNLATWMDVLGCNPAARTNFHTTNREYAEAEGLDPALVDDLFRFEFGGAGLRPCVCCDSSHANYFSFRSKGTGLIQFQIDRAEKVEWFSTPVFTPTQQEEEVVPEVSDMTLSLLVSDIYEGETKFTCGEWLRVKGHLKNPWAGYSGVKQHHHGGDGHSLVPAAKAGELISGDCFLCDRKDALLHCHHVCEDCWTVAWFGFSCPKEVCNTSFSVTPPTLVKMEHGKFKSVDCWEIHAKCPSDKCGGMTVTVPCVTTDPTYEHFVAVKDAYHGRHSSTKEMLPFSRARAFAQLRDKTLYQEHEGEPPTQGMAVEA
ncbi:MAG: hypothetical protein A2Y38_11660 [Spirochaetes bacterium GWB1_59_5]|nr:MAG: hypothetical protein A2Y38_11660 [Spirochaetes bacterium GWB1_59_5]